METLTDISAVGSMSVWPSNLAPFNVSVWILYGFCPSSCARSPKSYSRLVISAALNPGWLATHYSAVIEKPGDLHEQESGAHGEAGHGGTPAQPNQCELRAGRNQRKNTKKTVPSGSQRAQMLSLRLMFCLNFKLNAISLKSNGSHLILFNLYTSESLTPLWIDC